MLGETPSAQAEVTHADASSHASEHVEVVSQLTRAGAPASVWNEGRGVQLATAKRTRMRFTHARRSERARSCARFYDIS